MKNEVQLPACVQHDQVYKIRTCGAPITVEIPTGHCATINLAVERRASHWQGRAYAKSPDPRIRALERRGAARPPTPELDAVLDKLCYQILSGTSGFVRVGERYIKDRRVATKPRRQGFTLPHPFDRRIATKPRRQNTPLLSCKSVRRFGVVDRRKS